eukprot:TRINITY_DN9616_c0_g1_i1.p1 TRINITY_DN9616_c0_g1~~TRINITY_DN9616_c0_g1_i1.p1  ORF type:complete len:452 (-),score=87.99 TRINITY_DN9616_c0_g1_i1:53-1408(-)
MVPLNGADVFIDDDLEGFSGEDLEKKVFYLGIHIVRGQDLPYCDRHGETDPYFRIWLDGELIGKTATLSKKKGDPRWYEEFMLVCHEGDPGLIDLELKENLILRKNHTLGNTVLNFWQVEDGEQWLDIEANDFQSRVLVQFTRYDYPPTRRSGKIPFYRIELEKDTYVPGEEVRGKVIYHALEPVSLKKDLMIHFYGKEIVYWVDPNYDSLVYTNVNTYFHEKDTLFSLQEGDYLEGGLREWDFQYHIPEDGLHNNFTDNFESNRSKIEYSLRSTLHRKKKEKIHTFSTFNVIVQETCEEPIEDVQRDEKNRVEIKANFNTREIFLNEEEQFLSFDLNITNLCDVTWETVQVTLREFQKAEGTSFHSGRDVRSWVFKRLKQKNRVFIEPHQSEMTSFVLDPSSVLYLMKPSVDGLNLMVWHNLTVHVKSKKGPGKKTVKLEFPIVVTKKQE